MVDMRWAALKVRRSLLQRDLMAGVPMVGLLFILVLSIVFLYVLRMYFMIAPIIVLYLIMRLLTSRDPWMIDMVLQHIRQKDVYIP